MSVGPATSIPHGTASALPASRSTNVRTLPSAEYEKIPTSPLSWSAISSENGPTGTRSSTLRAFTSIDEQELAGVGGDRFRADHDPCHRKAEETSRKRDHGVLGARHAFGVERA